MANYKAKGRPTTKMVSVLDTQKNSIVFTGSISDFVDSNFQYCSAKVKRNAKGAMYQSLYLRCSAFGGKVRVFDNLESI